MPKAVHKLAKRMEKHKDGIKNPWALATYMVKQRKKRTKAKDNPGHKKAY